MSSGWLSPWAIWKTAAQKWQWKSDDPLVPSWEFPPRSGYVPILQSDDVYIKHVEQFSKILAAAADYIRSNEDLSAATPITFTIDAQPDVPRNITWAFDSHAQITAFSFTITGTDAKGNEISDTFTEADGWSGATEQAYATITAIIMDSRTGTGAGDTMDIGIGSILGLANNIDLAADIIKVNKSAAAGNAADYSGDTVNVTADVTNDTLDVSTGAAIVDGDNYTIWYKSRLYTQG